VKRLLLASANPGKLREFREAALAYDIEVEPVPGIGKLPPCVEDGPTFEANARKKALHYSRYTSGLVFADDSGLLVDALGGAPGVRSARFAGEDADDQANNLRLLSELARVRGGGGAGREMQLLSAAHYLCIIALAERGQILAVTEGRADGVIISQPRGAGGFGYDPYFLYPPLGKTFAELSAEEKFAVSHRGAAFRALLATLGGILEAHGRAAQPG
jgi:XTP/dITP diphosphohydrolase